MARLQTAQVKTVVDVRELTGRFQNEFTALNCS
jgi:hypothetical protein